MRPPRLSSLPLPIVLAAWEAGTCVIPRIGDGVEVFDNVPLSGALPAMVETVDWRQVRGCADS